MTKLLQTLLPLIAVSFLFPTPTRSEIEPQPNQQSLKYASAEQAPHEHVHEKVEIPQGQPIPQVELTTYPDEVKGWNLEIKLTNFVLTPENVNQANELNEGHAHLFVNGEKITRIYSNWYYLQKLPQGKNSVKVVLNTNDHGELSYQGQAIADTKIIEVQ